jgi:putative selenate reductase FAD-binding subunit
MIKEYFRPNTIEEAIQLLKLPGSIIMGGGTFVNSSHQENVTVVDIQDLELKSIQKDNNLILVGSSTILQDLIKNKHIPEAIKQAISIDSPLNIRNMATIGGYIITATGTSVLSTVLLAMEATIQFTPGLDDLTYTEFITSSYYKGGRLLITSVNIPNHETNFNVISLTPTSRVIVCAAITTKPNGRTRLTLGGYGENPLLVFDGSIEDDIVSAAKSAYLQAGDEWASSEYRSEMAAILTKRCLSEMSSNL